MMTMHGCNVQPPAGTAPQSFRRRRLALLILLLVTCGSLAARGRAERLLAATAAPQPEEASPINAREVLVPKQLGAIRARFDGAGHDRRMVFLIGENHVSAPVQSAVAELLGYLAGAYDLKLVCAEGFFGDLPLTGGDLPLPAKALTLRSKRAAAGALLAARQIRAIEYAALSYPELRVVGVEDMAAYQAHRAKLVADEQRASQTPKAKQWQDDMQRFLAGLTLNQEQLRQMEAAGVRAKKDCDAGAPLRTLLELVGPKSPDGIKLAALVHRREVWQAAAARRLLRQAPDPLLERRNHAMVENTLARAGDAGPLALVIGSLHVPGIEKELRMRGVPYISILPAGMTADLIGPSASSDACVYDKLQNGSQTDFERFFSRLPPPIAMARPTFRDKTAALSALANADLMLSEGVRQDDVTRQTRLPEGARIVRVFTIPAGHGMEIERGGETAFVYFGATPQAVAAGAGARLLEEGVAGGRYFAAYGGDGGKPPIPPGGLPDSGDPGDFGRRVQQAIVVRDQNSRGAVAVTFDVEGDELVRRVDGRFPTPLGISVAAAAAMIQGFRKASSGPDKLYAAQQISRVLLADVDAHLPPGRTRLQLIAAGDFAGNESLPEIARLAGDPGSARFAQLAESYVTPWKQAQQSLAALSRAPSRATAGSTVVWIADDLRARPAGRQALRSIAASGIRVNEITRHGDTLLLLSASADGWAITLNDGSAVTAADPRLLQAVSAASSVVALNVRLPGPAAAAAKELRAQPLPPAEALDLAAKVAQALKRQAGDASIDRLLREATEERAERARDEMRKRDHLATLNSAVAGALEIHSTATMAQ
jgi:hypothetical protein